MVRQACHLVIGLLVLGLAYALLATPLPPGVPSGVAGASALMLNLAFGSVILTLLLIGSRRRHRGFVVAPLVFALLWFLASVAHRVQVQRTKDAEPADRRVPAGLAQHRTLIVKTEFNTPICCEPLTLLANGVIDTYVHALDTEMHALRLASGTECTPEDLQRSRLLTDVGRTDECIRKETIRELPDGLVLRMNFARVSNRAGCCDEATVSVRSAGREQVVAVWRSGRVLVLSYFPLFGGLRSPPTRLWEAALIGPLQPVQIGGPSFGSKDVGEAIYGAEWRRPVKPRTG